MIKAIETVYKGYKFRSRLEARWAVFFDALEIKWQFEVEGYEKQFTDDETIRYLPDFYLLDTKTWVEVKSGPDMLSKSGEKLGHILDYGSPIPGIDDSYYSDYGHGLLILYDIPYLNWGLVLHPFITHAKGLNVGYAVFIPDGVCKLSRDELKILNCFIKEDEIDLDRWIDGYSGSNDEWFIKQYIIEAEKAYNKVIQAYEKARQARFEHGEKG